MNYINLTLIFLLIIMLCYVAFKDILERRIPNTIVLIILILSVLSGFAHGFNPDSFIIAIIVVFIGTMFSFLGVIGAGDVKLMAALCFSLPKALIMNFFISVSFAGIPVALITCVYYKFFMRNNKITVPYGVAIVIGYVLTVIYFV